MFRTVGIVAARADQFPFCVAGTDQVEGHRVYIYLGQTVRIKRLVIGKHEGVVIIESLPRCITKGDHILCRVTLCANLDLLVDRQLLEIDHIQVRTGCLSDLIVLAGNKHQ